MSKPIFYGDNLYEMSKPNFMEKQEKYFAEILHSILNIK